MLTDEQAVQLLEAMRRDTQSTAVAALCDWALGLARRWNDAVVAPAAARAALQEARKAHRRTYMRELMRKRAAQRRSLQVSQI
jgi:hypothetical protein